MQQQQQTFQRQQHQHQHQRHQQQQQQFQSAINSTFCHGGFLSSPSLQHNPDTFNQDNRLPTAPYLVPTTGIAMTNLTRHTNGPDKHKGPNIEALYQKARRKRRKLEKRKAVEARGVSGESTAEQAGQIVEGGVVDTSASQDNDRSAPTPGSPHGEAAADELVKPKPTDADDAGHVSHIAAQAPPQVFHQLQQQISALRQQLVVLSSSFKTVATEADAISTAQALDADATSTAQGLNTTTCPVGKKKPLKSTSRQLADEVQRSVRMARQALAKATRHRRSEKLNLKNLRRHSRAGRPNPKPVSGTAPALPSGVSSTSGPSELGHVQALCRFYITDEDRRRVCQSSELPEGNTQNLRSCVREPCLYLHTAEASATNRDRLIQTRRRKMAAALRPPPRASPAMTQGWLKQFDFDKGYGFITPIKLAKGSQPRRQQVFFHKNDWVGTPALAQGTYKLPLRVRYLRVASEDVRKGGKAVQVSATGPRTT